jgi:phosphoglycerate dehydrogenase-like enzyme
MGSRFSSTLNGAPLNTLLVTGVPLSAVHRTKLEEHFKTVLHWPRGSKEIVADDLTRADVIFGFMPEIKRRDDVPNLKFVQLASAGAELALDNPLWKDETSKDIQLCNASGVHTFAIPQYFIATTLALFHQLQPQILISQNEKRWATDADIAGQLFVRELRSCTVGVLGYGHIGREAARLSKAFGAKVVAATSDGMKKKQQGWAIEGTGDPDGSIPSQYYSTKDPASFASFLQATDVLLVALPSTPATRYILNDTTLAYLRPTSILVNIGRGDLISTPALLSALDSERLAGAALDVTDPEPLPTGHPLFGRKNVIVTPHLSGRTEKYFELALEILMENVKRYTKGDELVNLVDRKRGY